jgi:phage virion morphogenesis protein
MIDIDVDVSGLEKAAKRLEQFNRSKSPLMRILSESMKAAVEENFARQGRPEWLGFAPSTLRRRQGGIILQNNGRLVASIEGRWDDASAIVGTNVHYAAIHQFGGEIRRPPKPGRRGKRPSKGGTTTIPARPFLKLTDEDTADMESTVSGFLSRMLD